MVGIAFSTAALIIVLSVFNGLEDLLRSLYASFDPEIKIEAVKGKSFEVDDAFLAKIESIEGVQLVTEVIEDYAIVRYRDAYTVVTIKGVSDNFIDQHRLDEHIDEGKLLLKDKGVEYAIIGRGVKYTLSLSLEDDFDLLQIFYIKNLKSAASLNPSQIYSQRNIKPGSVFSIEKNYDENYIFLPLDFVQDLLDYGKKRTALEVKTIDNAKTSDVQARLKDLLGSSFSVLTNEEQHKDLYRLLKYEKLFTFLALSLLITIGSINIFFSLMMLAIDMKKDISILSALGGGQSLILKIFMAEGALISLVGAGAGLIIGGVVCWVQDHFGVVGMGMVNSVVPDYPVRLNLFDFLSTSVVIVLITFLVSVYPATRAAKFRATDQL
jgi:lipoprotein-releasing system permease protein